MKKEKRPKKKFVSILDYLQKMVDREKRKKGKK